MRARSTLVLLSLGLSACDPQPGPGAANDGSSGEGSTTTRADATGTTGAMTAASSSAGTTTGPQTSSSDSTDTGAASTSTGPSGCDGFEPGEAFEIAADVSPTRIHPHAAGDATGAWFTFAHPEPAGPLADVSVMHLRCAADVDVEPTRVNTDPGNDIDGSVAVFDDRVLVVWNTDDGSGGSSNLQIHGRVLDLAGVPLTDAAFRVTTSVRGRPILGNHTLAIASADEDGFRVAGLRAHPDSPAFVAFDQALDADGALLGPASSPPIEAGVSHLHASSGGGWLAYGRSDEAGDQVWLTHPDQDAVAAFGGAPATAGVVLDRPEARLEPLVAAALGSGTSLDIGVALFAGDPLQLGEPGYIEHSPSVAQSPDGALALVYHRNQSGFDNAVVFQRLRLRGSQVLADGDAVELDTLSPPYPPSITWTPGGWLVTWSRGTSPDFSTWGRVMAPA